MEPEPIYECRNCHERFIKQQMSSNHSGLCYWCGRHYDDAQSDLRRQREAEDHERERQRDIEEDKRRREISSDSGK